MTKTVVQWKPKVDEEFEHECFQIEVTDNLIFFWGGGQEGCIPKRLLPNIIKFLEKHNNVALST